MRIDRPVGDEEVFFGDPRAAVMAGSKRSIAHDRVDPNVDGLGLFVVEEKMAGFSQGQRLEKVRHRARDTGQLVFDEVSVTIESVLGKVAGQGSFII